jgi:hypothetical protein
MAGELFFKIDILRPPADCAAVFCLAFDRFPVLRAAALFFLPRSSINFFSYNATINFGGCRNIMLVEWMSEGAVSPCFHGVLAGLGRRRNPSSHIVTRPSVTFFLQSS